MVAVPHKNARLAVLLAASVFACVAACIGLNALIRSNQSQTRLKKLAPAPTVLEIDVSAITNVGIVGTVGNILLSGTAFLALSATILPVTQGLANKTLRPTAAILAFTSLWVLVCMIPYIVFFARDSAGLRAFIGSTELPQSVVQQTAARSGHSTRYRTMWYLKLLAIFPWFSIVAGAIASFVLFRAASAVDAASTSAVAAPAPETKEVDRESDTKESVTHNEKAEA
ncbi:hypothetical protein MD484_g4234, partial [Candolleomyces efflorescens]